MIDLAIFLVMRPMPVFKPEMREANRQGDKSQTRRVMDPQPFPYDVGQPTRDMSWKSYIYPDDKFAKIVVRHCPYGDAGDYCYMREPLMRHGKFARYKDNDAPVLSLLTGEPLEWRWKKDVLSSIFMPREAARFVYRYESIRVERVQDITRDDAKAEGVSAVWKNPPEKQEHYERVMLNPYVANYSVLWDEINAERGFGWDVNPYVWVLKYAPLSASQTSPHLEEHKMGGEGEEV